MLANKGKHLNRSVGTIYNLVRENSRALFGAADTGQNSLTDEQKLQPPFDAMEIPFADLFQDIYNRYADKPQVGIKTGLSLFTFQFVVYQHVYASVLAKNRIVKCPEDTGRSVVRPPHIYLYSQE